MWSTHLETPASESGGDHVVEPHHLLRSARHPVRTIQREARTQSETLLQETGDRTDHLVMWTCRGTVSPATGVAAVVATVILCGAPVPTLGVVHGRATVVSECSTTSGPDTGDTT